MEFTSSFSYIQKAVLSIHAMFSLSYVKDCSDVDIDYGTHISCLAQEDYRSDRRRQKNGMAILYVTHNSKFSLQGNSQDVRQLSQAIMI